MSKELPASLQLRVITPQKLLVDKDVKAVFLPSLEGTIGILPGHRPLLTAIGRGMLVFLLDRKEEKFSVRGGFAEVLPEKVLVFTELSDDADE